MLKPQLFFLFICTMLLIPTGAKSTRLRCVVMVNESLSARATRELEGSTAVFSGKVIAAEYKPINQPTDEEPAGSEILVMKIEVDRWWKGDGGEIVEMYTSITKLPNGLTRTMAEDFNFEVGQNYLIYAYGKPERLGTNVCKLTRKIEGAADQLLELGEGWSPRKNTQ
jgi:hypothetical protein